MSSSPYMSQRSVVQGMNQPVWAATPDRMGYLTRYPHSEAQTGMGRQQQQQQTMEGFCSSGSGVNQCLGEPVQTSVVNTSNTISGCPTCGSLREAFQDRTQYDQYMFNFYNSQVLPKLDTNLLNLSFAK